MNHHLSHAESTTASNLPLKTKSNRRTLWRNWLFALICGAGAVSLHAAASTHPKELKVTTKQIQGVTHFYVENLEPSDMTVTFDMNLSNLHCSTALPYTTTVPPRQMVEAFTLCAVTKDVPWSYHYTDSFTIGSTTAQHDDSYVYALPYAAGESFRVSQGYHGGFSHTGPDEYAIDWKMPLGTPVHAARGGIVVEARDDSNAGGPDRKFESCANCILIRHTDGTIGIYAHLSKGGNRVKVGDEVKTGDWIGLSGNTGFTSGPHLHFSVFKARSGKERESIPVRFQTGNASAQTLAVGETYKAIFAATQQAKLPAPMIATMVGRKKS